MAEGGGPGYPESYHPGIYGWRKRCLYSCVVLLLILLILNVALTIWILRVMDFNPRGMGKMRITESGIRVEGESEFLKPIRASHIRAPKGGSMTIESMENIDLCILDNRTNKCDGQIHIDKNRIDCQAKQFVIRHPDGRVLFSAQGRIATIGADIVEIVGSSGVEFKKSVTTPHIRAASALKIESPSDTLNILGPDKVDMRSPVGGVNITATDQLLLRSKGMISLDARYLYIENLRVARTAKPGSTSQSIYQLCVCASNGKLFLAEPGEACMANQEACS